MALAQQGAVGVPDTAGSGKKKKNTYMIWDAGFGRRFVLSLLVILVSAYCCGKSPRVQQIAWEAYQDVLFRLMEGAHKMAWWSVIGLLSSSCCALQLLLNAFNFGCAGFNTALGPLRPSLCALTVCTQAVVWYTAYDKPFQRLYVAPCTLVAAVLTLLPELVWIWVQRRAAPAHHTSCQRSCAVFSLEGMGCAACTKKVADVLERVPAVVGREISLADKEARVFLEVEPSEAQGRVADEVVRRLGEAGFEAKLGRVYAARGGEPSTPGGQGAGTADAPSAALGGGAAGLPLSISAGLLSSSCCLLQLGVNLMASLNLLHIGCAGFNKVLGPWRVHLRLLTGAWLLASWASCLRGGSWWRPAARRLAVRTAICLALTFLPEMLLWSGGPALAPPTDGAEVLQVKVEGMGCEACQAHVQGVMDRMGGVVGSSVDFEAGRARLTVQKGWAFDFDELSRRLEQDGYTASLRSDL